MTTSVNTARTGTGSSGAPFAGVGTFAQMKALASPSDGIGFLVTNYGRGGSMWRYSATNTDWFPTAPVLIYENTALVSGLVQTAAQILLAIPVEANLLANKRFRIVSIGAKSGATDTFGSTFRMGSAGTTADATVFSAVTALSGSNRSVGEEQWFHMKAGPTTVTRVGGNLTATFGGASSQIANTAVTVADVTAANFVSIACTMSGTTDTPQVGYTALEILP